MAANFRVSFVCNAETLDALCDKVSDMITDEVNVPIGVAMNLCDVYRALYGATLTSITEDPEVPRGIACI